MGTQVRIGQTLLSIIKGKYTSVTYWNEVVGRCLDSENFENAVKRKISGRGEGIFVVAFIADFRLFLNDLLTSSGGK